MLIRLLSVLFLCSLLMASYEYACAAKPPPPPLQITNIETLNFGVAIKPKFGNASIIVRKNSNLAGGTTAIMLDTKDVSAGRDRISGDKDNTIQIDLDQCASNSGVGLRIKDFDARYSGDTFIDSGHNLEAPGNGKNLVYGATLVINSTSATGHLSPCYYITVTYE